MVRSDHDERIVRISLPLKPIIGIQLERFSNFPYSLVAERRRKTRERRSFSTLLVRMLAVVCSSFVGHLLSDFLLSVCMCGYLYEPLRFRAIQNLGKI